MEYEPGQSTFDIAIPSRPTCTSVPSSCALHYACGLERFDQHLLPDQCRTNANSISSCCRTVTELLSSRKNIDTKSCHLSPHETKFSGENMLGSTEFKSVSRENCYTCTLCDKHFACPSDLAQHDRTHSRENEFMGHEHHWDGSLPVLVNNNQSENNSDFLRNVDSLQRGAPGVIVSASIHLLSKARTYGTKNYNPLQPSDSPDGAVSRLRKPCNIVHTLTDATFRGNISPTKNRYLGLQAEF